MYINLGIVNESYQSNYYQKYSGAVIAMHDSIFRTYDIRGMVGSELDLQEVYALGCAIALYFRSQNPMIQTIAIGMDGRTTSEGIKNDLSRALQDQGFNICFIGVCPSPVLYFALHTLPVQAGIMITASHNPGTYNGFKICLGTESVWGDAIQEIKNIYKSKQYYPKNKRGMYRLCPMIPVYIDYLVNQFGALKGMQRTIIFDCGNGATGVVLPELIEKMNWPNAKILYAEIDGNYPNHEADPTIRENMEDLYEAIKIEKADFGIGFDGDGDRMTPITTEGILIPGDQLLALFAYDMKKEHSTMGVVFDVKASMGLIELLNAWGLKEYMVPCGHSYVKQKMDQEKALLGGELSCHFCFSDRYFGFDDGIYAAWRLIEIVIKTGKTLGELLDIFPKKASSPELRIPCASDNIKDLLQTIRAVFAKRKDAHILDIDGPRIHLPYGWANIRASNTQPVLSVRFEGADKEGLTQIKHDFLPIFKQFIDEKVLKRYF
jgi:phosphomannomutase / phosphoglucomutase